jgi:SAM-dependent methyltransferase
MDPSSEAVVTRFDRNYADAVANLARETGFVDVKLTSLECIDRFEEEIGTQRRWLAVTGRKPRADLTDLQAKINAFWTWRGNTIESGGLSIRDERELQIWMEVLRQWLPSAPANVVDLGTGQGFLALMLAAFGHRVRGFDLAEGQLHRAREFGARVANPPVFATGDAIDPPLAPASVDVIANRNILWTLLDPARAFRNWFDALRPGGRLIAFHGINNSEGGPPPNTRDQNNTAYTEDVTARLLPIRRLPTVDPAIPLVREAGFQDVQVRRLQALEDFEREAYGADKTWLVITAVRPGA